MAVLCTSPIRADGSDLAPRRSQIQSSARPECSIEVLIEIGELRQNGLGPAPQSCLGLSQFCLANTIRSTASPTTTTKPISPMRSDETIVSAQLRNDQYSAGLAEIVAISRYTNRPGCSRVVGGGSKLMNRRRSG